MKLTKRIMALTLVLVSLMGILAGCGGKKYDVEINDDGTTVQGKKAVIAYNSMGYGNQWLKTLAEKFNEMYAEEGYTVELKISMANEFNPSLEIGKGAERNDVDMYLDAANLESLLEASERTMRGNGAVLVDMKESVWDQPAIGFDKQEESKTIGERFTLNEEYVFYNGKDEKYHGGIYVLPTGMEQVSVGINVNPKVIEQYGYSVDNLPRTTNEFNAMCDKIAETSKKTGVYAYSWAGGNASGYLAYLYYEYFAQYTGYENFMNFVETKPFAGATVEDIKAEGYKIYEDKGILEAFKAMAPIMEPKYSTNGSASMDHMAAQHQLLTGKAAFMITGDWLLAEMKDQYYEEASQCVLMKTPVLSVIGTECGITDAELSNAVKMIDEGKSDADIMAAISGLDAQETARIREARNIYGGGEAKIRSGITIPAYADGRDVAILFARFICSEDALRVIRNEGNKINCYTCESYDFEKETPYMQSVLANMNMGEGKYISMDNSLSILRSNSNMLCFNHPTTGYPYTFKNMIMDTTGNMDPENLFELEKKYAQQYWSTWTAYID